MPDDAGIGLAVPLGCRLDRALRKGREWWLAVPASRLSLGLEEVAHGLLVERHLRSAGAPLLGVPEARRVGRQDLVDQEELAVRPARSPAELELRVGEDEAVISRVLAPLGVHSQRPV